jgi:hypothetical protein
MYVSIEKGMSYYMRHHYQIIFFQCLTKDDVAGEDENTSKCDSELYAFGEWEENLHKAYKDKYPKRCEKTGGVDAISTDELNL